ncbi:10431_t:CDS:2 [Cetraspora pellucida]|uniref:10431_t:CDS:1 n=1 Tax=Cetraspora pellucida TaxID=1433469 RepID=A0A9N9D7R6_9GLOM|nr:10431_t:CDS:2 [Cetraspora pellucida]
MMMSSKDQTVSVYHGAEVNDIGTFFLILKGIERESIREYTNQYEAYAQTVESHCPKNYKKAKKKALEMEDYNRDKALNEHKASNIPEKTPPLKEKLNQSDIENMIQNVVAKTGHIMKNSLNQNKSESQTDKGITFNNADCTLGFKGTKYWCTISSPMRSASFVVSTVPRSWIDEIPASDYDDSMDSNDESNYKEDVDDIIVAKNKDNVVQRQVKPVDYECLCDLAFGGWINYWHINDERENGSIEGKNAFVVLRLTIKNNNLINLGPMVRDEPIRTIRRVMNKEQTDEGEYISSEDYLSDFLED